MLTLMLFATFVLIYLPGLIQLYLWTGASIGIFELLMIGMIPYIAADVIKAIVAASIAKAITPKKSYGREVDVEKAKNWHIP
jgi:biotin transport system substrate-specific component